MVDSGIKRGLTITVSGWAGVGKGTVANALAKDLGLKVVAMGDIFREMARERRIDLERFSATREDEIDHQIDKRCLELAREGGVVLDGRLTGMIAGDLADCKLLIKCDMEQKAERVAKREDISTQEARKRLEERDANDSAKYISLYGADGSQQDIYDAVIDTTHLDIEATKSEAIKVVRGILKRKESYF